MALDGNSVLGSAWGIPACMCCRDETRGRGALSEGCRCSTYSTTSLTTKRVPAVLDDECRYVSTRFDKPASCAAILKPRRRKYREMVCGTAYDSCFRPSLGKKKDPGAGRTRLGRCSAGSIGLRLSTPYHDTTGATPHVHKTVKEEFHAPGPGEVTIAETAIGRIAYPGDIHRRG